MNIHVRFIAKKSVNINASTNISICFMFLLLLSGSRLSAQMIGMAGFQLESVHNDRMAIVRKHGYVPFDGFVWLKTGKKIDGNVKVISHTSNVTDSKGAIQTLTYIDSFNVNDKSYVWTEIAFYGSSAEKTANDFCEFDKHNRIKLSKKDEENFQPGYIMMDENTKMEGLVAIRKNGEYGYVLFARSMEDKVQVGHATRFDFYEPYRIKHVVQKIDGKEIEYLPVQNAYEQADDAKYDPAYIITKEGKRIEGKGKFIKVIEENKGVGSYRHYSGFYFRPNNGYETYYLPKDVAFAGMSDDAPNQCTIFRNYFYNKPDLMKGFEKAPDGEIAFKNGEIAKGKVIAIKSDFRNIDGFYFMEKEGNYFKDYFSDPEVMFYSIMDEGKERKFLRVKGIYAEWFYSDKKVSYLQNPYPTHNRNGLDNVLKGTVSAVGSIAQQNSNVALEKTIKKGVNEGFNDETKRQMETWASASAAINQSVEALNQTDGIFFFNEYYMLINNRPPLIVYKKNMKETMEGLFKDCPALRNLKSNTLNDVDDIDEVVKFMNESGCF